tara:strand:- start:347 stop:616 length:270 start_codon:yes stop_codon:yes gene_type:complete
MSFKTYTVGRSSDADIQVNGQSVSRLHLELTVADGGKYYLIDANSSAGTLIQKSGSWETIKQGFVTENDLLMLGKESIQVRLLLDQIQH